MSQSFHFYPALKQLKTRFKVAETFVALASKTSVTCFLCFLKYYVVSYGLCEVSYPKIYFQHHQLVLQVSQIESSSVAVVLLNNFRKLFRALLFLRLST